jgi:tetratricopeptide (TPR) repeat protein
MSHDPAVNAALEAAEQAARIDDYAAAGRHLREAAARQEATIGPVHPDLANTLNNLGVACERAGRLDEAEASYRRAYAIAQHAFPPDHPFVLRSAENLRDFCEALGRPFEAPAPATAPASIDAPPEVPPIIAARPPSVSAPPPAPAPLTRLEPPVPDLLMRAPADTLEHTARAEPGRRSFPIVLGAGIVVIAAAIVAIWLFAGPRAPAQDEAAEPSRPEATAIAPPDAPAAAAAEPIASAAPDVSPPAAPADADAPTTAREAAAALSAPAGAEPAAGRAGPAQARSTAITLVRGDVCRNFSSRTTTGADWRCTAVHDSTTPGALVFYTRIRSPRATTIEHRWYYGNALVQRVELHIGANRGPGYRTYSRNTITADRAGTWRVELRDAAGTLVHEARFVVSAR